MTSRSTHSGQFGHVESPAAAPSGKRRVLGSLLVSLALIATVLVIPASGAQSTGAVVPNVVPPTPSSFSAQVDPLAGYVPQRTCSPSDKPGTTRLKQMLINTYGSAFFSTARSCAGNTSEHYEGRAVDWGMRVWNSAEKAKAEDFLDWLLATGPSGQPYEMARRLGVMYLIWNNRIWGAYSPERGWRPYSGCVTNPSAYSNSTCHRDHVHISLSWDGANARTSYWASSADQSSDRTASDEAVNPTRVTAAPEASQVYLGSPVIVRGQALAAPAGARVGLWRAPAGGKWTRLGDARIRSQGRYTVSDIPDQLGSFRYQSRIVSDGVAVARSTVMAVSLVKPPGLTASLDDSVIVSGETVVLRGSTYRVPSGSTLELWSAPKGGKWAAVSRARIRSNGRFTATVEAPQAGAYGYQARVVKDGSLVIKSRIQPASILPRPRIEQQTEQTSVLQGETVTVIGRVGGAPEGADVELWRSTGDGTWTSMSRARLRSLGRYTLRVVADELGVHQYQVRVMLDGRSLLGSDPLEIATVRPPSLSAAADSATVDVGDALVVRGRALRMPPGTVVELLLAPQGGSWETVDTGRIRSTSRYTLSAPVTTAGDYFARAVAVLDGEVITLTRRMAVTVR